MIEHDLLENKGMPCKPVNTSICKSISIEAIDLACVKSCIVKIANWKSLQTVSTLIRNSLRQ